MQTSIHPVVAKIATNPQLQAATAAVVAELTTRSIGDIYNTFMDDLATRIAKAMIDYEKKETQEKNNEL